MEREDIESNESNDDDAGRRVMLKILKRVQITVKTLIMK